MGQRIDSIREVMHGMGEDFRRLREEHGLAKSIGLVAMGAAIVPYQLAGLETSVGLSTMNTYDVTHNPILAGVAAGTTSGIIEAGLTLGLVAGLRRFPDTTAAYTKVKYGDKKPGQEQGGGFTKFADAVKNVGVASTLGSPGIVLGSYAVSPEADMSVHRRRGLNTAAALGVANTVLAGVLMTGIWANERYGAAEWSEGVVDVFKNPLTYGGILLAGFGLSALARRIKR